MRLGKGKDHVRGYEGMPDDLFPKPTKVCKKCGVGIYAGELCCACFHKEAYDERSKIHAGDKKAARGE